MQLDKDKNMETPRSIWDLVLSDKYCPLYKTTCATNTAVINQLTPLPNRRGGCVIFSAALIQRMKKYMYIFSP